MKRRMATIATSTLGIAGLAFLPATSASAAPLAASGCNGVVCMSVTTPSANGSFTIKAWDRYGADCFHGHYEVGREGTSTVVNSPTGNWCHTNKYSHTFNLSEGKGNWCVIGWELKNGHSTDIGQPCEDVT